MVHGGKEKRKRSDWFGNVVENGADNVVKNGLIMRKKNGLAAWVRMV